MAASLRCRVRIGRIYVRSTAMWPEKVDLTRILHIIFFIFILIHKNIDIKYLHRHVIV